MASKSLAKGLKRSALTVALGLCFVGGVSAQTNTAGSVAGQAAAGGESAHRRADVDDAAVLDRHEVGADAHRHVLDVREDLVGHLVSVVSDPDFDLHLAYRVRIEVRLAEVRQQPVAIRDPRRLNLEVVAHTTSIPHRPAGRREAQR